MGVVVTVHASLCQGLLGIVHCKKKKKKSLEHLLNFQFFKDKSLVSSFKFDSVMES